MKSLLEKLLIFIFLSFCQNIFPQAWQRIYFPDKSSSAEAVIETYDKGFIIGGHYYDSHAYPTFGYILKTDINGYPLWDKHIGSDSYATGIYSLQQTSDGGYIFSGAKSSIDPSGDVFFAKADHCLNLEWCKMFSSNQGQFDFGRAIHGIPGGYIALVEQYGNDIVNKRTWLFRLDTNGEIIWQQSYGHSDSLIMAETCFGLVVTPDQHYEITGFCYSPDSGTTSPICLKPLIIKVDSIGTVVWELPWSYTAGEPYQGQSFRSIIDNQGNIYSCGRHIEEQSSLPGDRPTMIKTDALGNEIAYFDIFHNTWQAITSTIDWFQDSTIALGGGWIFSPGDTVHEGAFKVSKEGELLKTKHMLVNDYTFRDALTTFDNKLLLVATLYTNMYNSYAWKLNSDLEYDTLYTYPYVYDSLCPHPIASDTIPLDCVVVGLDEPFQNPEVSKLKVYPNPASDKIHIEIPEKLKTQSKSPVFDLTTVYHQWHSAIIEIYDLFGRKMFLKKVLQAEKELEIDVSAWPRGMFVVRLVYNNQTVGSEKIVVE